MDNKVLLGVAKMDITPLKNVETVGYSREDNKSTGILHKLYAQIVVWSSEQEHCCFVTMDHIGFMTEDANTVRDEIGEKLGIPRDKVMICFSHTHSGPNISLETEYFEELRKQVLIGVDEAKKNMAPVKVAWAMPEVDIGVNRRDEKGALDKRLGILKVVDADTDKLRLLLLRLTAHNNILPVDICMISSDFIGITRELLEKKYGCDVMITQGASGNVKAKYSGSAASMDKMAEEIERVVTAAIKNMEPQPIDKLQMYSKKVAFSSEVPTKKRAAEISEEAMRENYIDGTMWLKEIERLHANKVKEQQTEVEIQYFIVNNGCYCGVANEVMCELALEVVKACNDNLIYFGGYTNGCVGYLPTAEEFDKGGFEVLHSYLIFYIYHGTVMPLKRDTAEKLVQAVAMK